MTGTLGFVRSRKSILVWAVVAFWMVFLLYDRRYIEYLPSTVFFAPAADKQSAYYHRNTSQVFPSLIGGELKDANFCSNFPSKMLEQVQVVFKTGVSQRQRNEAHFSSDTSCIPNMIVVSDLEEQVGSHHHIDVLAKLPLAYLEHEDFAVYHEQKKAYLEGTVEPSPGGWKLDRFKFLPMVNVAWETNPHARWYVFLEADVYIFWDNLFRLLEQMDPLEEHYLGSAVAGSYHRWFAYGGAGIILSQGLMSEFVGDGTVLSDRYQKMVLDDCCGDAVLAYAIHDKTGIRLEDLYPMFSGDDIEGLKINQERWCVPLISLHRMTETQLHSVWQWERSRPNPQRRPLTFSDFLGYRQPFLRHSMIQNAWDNLSEKPASMSNGADHPLIACAQACAQDKTCLQFSLTQGRCRSSQHIMHGHAVDDSVQFSSGWDEKKLRDLGLRFLQNGTVETGCRQEDWRKPLIRT